VQTHKVIASREYQMSQSVHFTFTPMPHSYSRQAFYSVATTAALPDAVRLYANLVTIELMLKDTIAAGQPGQPGQWQAGHDLHLLLVAYDPALAALGTNLKSAIAALYCTDKTGNAAPVSGSNYPHMRYLRHSSDSAPPHTTVAELNAAYNLAVQCVQQLGQQGLVP
jgi:hypothetical protein